MKTQIIHLEPHDDRASVLDKLNWAKAERLVLVWPGRNRVLTDKLDLRLIQRSAERRGAQIGILSLDPDVQAHAASLGIPIFEELKSLHAQNWFEKPAQKSFAHDRTEGRADLHELQSSVRSRSRTKLPSALRITLFTLSLILVLLAVIALIPSAVITVNPVREEHQEMLAYPISETADQASDFLRIDKLRVDGSVRLPTSGRSSEPDDFARGVAEFTNLSDEAVVIPAGTTVRSPESDQLYFTTQKRITLPAEIESTRQVDIIASLPGTNGNIGSGQITAVDGQLGLFVSVLNPEPTTGGSDIFRSAVSISDLNRARAQLQQLLLDQATELIEANQLSNEDILFESLVVDEILVEEFDREVGETADTIELTMDVIVSVLIVDLDVFNQQVREDLLPLLEQDQEIVPGSLEVLSLQLDDSSSAASRQLQAAVSYELYNKVNKPGIAKAIRGKQPLNAQRFLADEYPHNNFTIVLYPEWLELLPFLQPQIEVLYAWEGNS